MKFLKEIMFPIWGPNGKDKGISEFICFHRLYYVIKMS